MLLVSRNVAGERQPWVEAQVGDRGESCLFGLLVKLEPTHYATLVTGVADPGNRTGRRDLAGRILRLQVTFLGARRYLSIIRVTRSLALTAVGKRFKPVLQQIEIKAFARAEVSRVPCSHLGNRFWPGYESWFGRPSPGFCTTLGVTDHAGLKPQVRAF